MLCYALMLMCTMHNASTSWNVPERGTRSSVQSCHNDMRFDLLTLRFCRDIDELRWRWIPRRRALNFVSVLAYWITHSHGAFTSWRELFLLKVRSLLAATFWNKSKLLLKQRQFLAWFHIRAFLCNKQTLKTLQTFCHTRCSDTCVNVSIA